MALLGFGEYAEVKLVVDTGLLVSRQLHVKLNHVSPMIDGVLHAGQCVLPYMGTMLSLGVRVTQASMSHIQTVPVFCPVVPVGNTEVQRVICWQRSNNQE